MKPGARRSMVWVHFEKHDNKVLCKLCMKEYNFSGNTTNMRVHLRKKHSGEYDADDSERDPNTPLKQFNIYDDEKLIYLVSENDCLYNQFNKDYGNYVVKDSIWANIAVELNGEMEECKARWTTLRNCYRRYLRRFKKENVTTGKRCKWRYAEQMNFLRQHISEREDETEQIYKEVEEKPNAMEDQISDYPEHLETVLTSYEQQSYDQEAPNKMSVQKKNLMRFFDDIAETMCTFSEVDQAELKRNIFNMVISKQLEVLKKNETTDDV